MFSQRVLLSIFTILLLISGLSAGPGQQVPDVLEFENGHTLRGDFLAFWNQSPDPRLLFGQPITEPFEHPFRKGLTVQYFERARMEYGPETDYQVRLADLGEWLYDETQRGDPANFPVNNSVCRLFPTNDKYVCYNFWQLYDRYQGAVYFGEPISNVEIVNGRYVQYFERARMEWFSDRPAGQRVVLTEIGSLDFEITIGNADYKQVRSQAGIKSTLTRLSVHAFVSRPLLADGQQQVLYVVVQDQFKQPVQDVAATVYLISPNGSKDTIRPAQNTNIDGFTTVTIPVGSFLPNQVFQIEVEASQPNGALSRAKTWFRTWW